MCELGAQLGISCMLFFFFFFFFAEEGEGGGGETREKTLGTKQFMGSGPGMEPGLHYWEGRGGGCSHHCDFYIRVFSPSVIG